MLFRDFDTRTRPTLLSRISPSNNAPVGFAVLNGTAAIAYPQKLIAARGTNVVMAPSSTPISALLVVNDALQVRIGDELETVTTGGLKPNTSIRLAAKSKVAGSGTKTFIEAVQKTESVEFTAVNTEGTKIRLFAVPGILRAWSWNSLGLSAVINGKLLSWSNGSAVFKVLTEDRALNQARDVALVSPSQAAVAYNHIVVLYGNGRPTILVGMRARLFSDGSELYLFDQVHSLLWRVSNLDKLGNADSTASHAEELVLRCRKPGRSGELAFEELARLVGYREAARRTGRSNPCANTTFRSQAPAG